MNIRKKSYSQFALLDILCTTIGFFLGIYIRHDGFEVIHKSPVYEQVFFIFILSIIGIAFLFRPYEDFFRRGKWEEFVNVVKCTGAQMAIAVCYMFIMQSGYYYSRLAFGYAFIATLLITYMVRRIAKKFCADIVSANFHHSKLLVVTTSDRAESIIHILKKEPSMMYDISGLVIMDCDMIGEQISGINVSANAETLYDDARMEVVDSVLIDLEPDYPEFKSTVNLFHVMGVEVNISLFDYNLGIPHQQVIKMGDLTVLSGNVVQPTVGDKIAKRTLDILGGIVGLLLTGVLTLFVAPAIMIESPGPIFFSQMRIGKNGRRFKIYKFRSMYMDAEERKKELMEQNKMSGLMFKMDDDPRITKVGKFIRKTSIDEFPQFLNVLKGDMSLVGTRPPTEDEFKQYKARYKKRLSMKPGITGLWQVSGRSEITDFEDVVKLDVKYIENWSFGLDLRILFQTVLVVLKNDGAQ